MPSALVTGASSGIGRAFARKLSATGYDLVVVARDEARLKELASECGTAVDVVAADLTDAEQLAVVEKRAADVDLLVNNAGFGYGGRFVELPVAGEEAQIRLNVLALVRLTHAAVVPMVARGRGGVINVSSMGSFQPGPFIATYAATKAFVTNFTEGVAEELRGTGVKVMALCPGFTRTEFQARSGYEATSMPSFLWLSAEQVVDAALRDLQAGRVLSVPGLHYKAAAATVRFIPRTVLRRLAGIVSSRSAS